MKVGLRISFELNSIKSDNYSNIFNKFVKFHKHGFRKNFKTYPWDEKKHFKQLMNIDYRTDISVYSDNNDIFSVGTTSGSKYPHNSVHIVQDSIFFLPENEEIEALIEQENFVSAYLCNDDYESIQSEYFENNLKGRTFSPEIWSSIRNTPYKLGVFDDKEYDIKFNPGRNMLIGYTWLMAAWKMWFGKSFFHIVPKEKLLLFEHAIEVRELANDIVYIQLYDKLEQPFTPDSVFRQWKWQEYLGFDALEKKFS